MFQPVKRSAFRAGEKWTPQRANSFAMLPLPWPVCAKIASSATPRGWTFHRLHMPTISSARIGTVQPRPSLARGEAFDLPAASASTGAAVDARVLSDSDLTSGVTLTSVIAGPNPSLTLDYGKVRTFRSARLFVGGGALPLIGPLMAATLEVSEDKAAWAKVTDIPVDPVPTTVSFPPASGRYFRIVLKPALGGGGPPPAGDNGLAMEDIFGTMIGGLLMKPAIVGDFRLSGEARVDRSELKSGFALIPDYFALPAVADGAAGAPPARTINLTSLMRSDGSLDWTPPPGDWRIIRFGYSLLGTTNHPATEEATGLEVDKYDGNAVRRYMEHYIAMYRDATGPDLIGKKGVRALLTDSIEVGAANWTPEFVARFKSLRGYDPLPWLPAIAGTLVGTREDTDRFLFDYRRTLAELISSEHYRTVAEVAHENGLIVYGEAQESGRHTMGDDMAMRSHADVPMAALWTYPKGQGPRLDNVVDIKGAASVAHIYGRKIVAAESLTASMAPWAFGPADLKRMVDLEFVLGVNRPVIHTSVHVPRDDKVPGLSLGGIGQFFNRNESWAELARPWVDYLARNSFMLQQGVNVADVAYYYGEEAPITGLYSKAPVADAPRGYAYDFVNVDALANALTNDGPDLITPGGARYKVLYLGGSSRISSLATLRRIEELARGGATIVGMKPVASPGLADRGAEFATIVSCLWGHEKVTQVGKGLVIASTDVEAALSQIGARPALHLTGAELGSQVLFNHRRLADGESLFISNREDKPLRIEARFRIAGKVPELWHADTGKSEAISYRTENGETVLPLELLGEQSVHVVFRKTAAQASLTVPKVQTQVVMKLDGPWEVAFQPGRGAPKSVTMPALKPLNESADPAIRHFSGIATYSLNFDMPRNWRKGRPLWLDLGNAREIAEVELNGAIAGHAWHAPYRIDISGTARRGRNTLKIQVGNLWVNRLIGDAQPGAAPVTWTDTATYKPTAELRPSGLIGPVILTGR